ncbi:hypothetical protein ACLOJK_027288 [Asimina triloba]
MSKLSGWVETLCLSASVPSFGKGSSYSVNQTEEQSDERCTIVEHLRCSTTSTTSTRGRLPPLPPELRPPDADATISPAVLPVVPPAAHHVDAGRRRRPTNDVVKGKLATAQTHHGRAPRQTIQAIHHDGNNEHIPNPSRLQADVDHSGHTRKIFLTPPHQQIRAIHHVHKIEPVLKLSGSHPTNVGDYLPMLPHSHLVQTLPAQTRPSAASIDRARRHDKGLYRTIQAAHHDDHREDVVSTVYLQPASPATTPRSPAPTVIRLI